MDFSFLKDIDWVAVGVVYLAFHKLLTSIRDVIDKTPDTDDNLFEKAVTIMGKLVPYLLTGKRPQ